MAAGECSVEPEEEEIPRKANEETAEQPASHHNANESENEDDGDEDEEEPRLKYATLTKSLSNVYRNGDISSAYFVAGDKMIVGTHNGNIHVLALPAFDTLYSYRAHSTSVSSISISPYPPPLPSLKPDATQRLAAESAQEKTRAPPASPNAKGSPRQPPVPNTPANQIHIATSSIDGNVCVLSLVDPKDIQLRNFGRPVQSVALSPQYKSDKSYLTGGQAGNLILTSGAQAGRSNATTTGTSAAASSWLGSIGLGSNTGTDKILHSGEGIISTIKWSRSGKYVLWVNEHGIKIMRSHLQLEAGEAGQEWKRFSHVDRPDKPGWEEMSAVWKARAEWIDRDGLEVEGDQPVQESQASPSDGPTVGSSAPPEVKVASEEVVVGWGNFVWIIKVLPDDGGAIKSSNSGKSAHAEIVTIIRFDDCTISGVSLYTPNLLLVLAYMERKGSASDESKSNGSKRGRQRHNALEPELRLIDINTKEEVDTDTLTISRFETLSSSDYDLVTLSPIRITADMIRKGYLGALESGVSAIGSGIGTVGSGLYTGVETVGQGVWDATMYGPRMLGANKLFSGSDSIRSGKPGPEKAGSGRERNYLTGWIPGFGPTTVAPNEETKNVTQSQGVKVFLFSPYDCIVAVKRNLADRLQWLIKTQRYEDAWSLADEHPEAAGMTSETSDDSASGTPSQPSSLARSASGTGLSPLQVRQKTTLAEFFADSASVSSSKKTSGKFSAAEKEKRRIGELWLKQLVDAGSWSKAGEVAGKVLNTSTRWEYWIWIFIKAKRFDEISPYVPTLDLLPPLPSSIFEIVLDHYASTNRARFKELLDQWPSDLFEISTITSAIEDQLKSDSAQSGSRDWRLLQECLAKLLLAEGQYDNALKCYIRLQDADTVMSMIKDHHLIEAIADDIPSFVQIRVSAEQLKNMPREELNELVSEPIGLLVDEATHGVVQPDEVVTQLETAALPMFIFFYLRALWYGDGSSEKPTVPRVGHSAAISSIAADSGKALVDQFADTAVELFAEYDRPLLMDFLHNSVAYTFEKAVKICEKKHFTDELVYLLSKTGQVKKALFLIIDELKDVSKAIEFAKEQDDKALWDDFLDYSMSRPQFISGLLSEVGTAIDPITLVKRIPSGLEVQGLRDGLRKMIREYDLQDSISSGVARVLSSEVAIVMQILRQGRRRGIRFEIPPQKNRRKENPEQSIPGAMPPEEQNGREAGKKVEILPGHCASCKRTFHPNETETLVGFACGHVYHVSHLLHGPDHEGGEEPSGLPDLNKDKDDQEEADTAGLSEFQRTVGPKVTSARLLKDKIESVGGCKVCSDEKKRLEQV